MFATQIFNESYKIFIYESFPEQICEEIQAIPEYFVCDLSERERGNTPRSNLMFK